MRNVLPGVEMAVTAGTLLPSSDGAAQSVRTLTSSCHSRSGRQGRHAARSVPAHLANLAVVDDAEVVDIFSSQPPQCWAVKPSSILLACLHCPRLELSSPCAVATQLAPFPFDLMMRELRRYPNAQLMWAQVCNWSLCGLLWCAQTQAHILVICRLSFFAACCALPHRPLQVCSFASELHSCTTGGQLPLPAGSRLSDHQLRLSHACSPAGGAAQHGRLPPRVAAHRDLHAHRGTILYPV